MDNLETQTGINKWFILALGIVVFVIILLLSSLRANVASEIDGISINPVTGQDVQIQAGVGLNGGTITNTGTISLDAPICDLPNDKLQWDGSTFICIDEIVNPTTPTTPSTDSQTLFYNAGNLTISNGNTVNIPLGGSTGITSITAGNGLSGGVITTTGVVSLNAPTCALGETLSWNGTVLSCVSVAGGGTLDNAYDFGGPGLGRTITTDAGAVQFIDPKTGGFAGYDPAFVVVGDGTPNNSAINGIALAKMDTQGGDDGSILLFATDVHDFTNGYYAFNSFSALPAAEFYQIGFSDGATRYANIMMMNGLMQIQSENGSGMDIQSDQDLFITSVNDTVRIRGQAQANSGGTQITNQNGANAAYVLTLNPALSGGINQLVGTGDPEGVWASDSGSVFFRTDGTGGAEQLYVKTTDAVNTGWVALGGASAGGGTLDDAYDFGGPGAGRTIFTDSGSVELVDSIGAVPFGYDPAFTIVGDGVGSNTAGAGLSMGRLDFGPFTGTGSIYALDVNNFTAGTFAYEIYADFPGNEFYNIGLSDGGLGDWGTLSFDTTSVGLSASGPASSLGLFATQQINMNGAAQSSTTGSVFIQNFDATNPYGVISLANGFGSMTQNVGAGDPNGVVDGFMGSLYFDVSGSGQPPIWAKETGSGTNTGWVQLAVGGPGGGTLQDAYNFGGPAAGNDLLVDTQGLRITSSGPGFLSAAGAFSDTLFYTQTGGTNNSFLIRDDSDGVRLTFASELFNGGANYYDMSFQGILDNFSLRNGLTGAGWNMVNQGSNMQYVSNSLQNNPIMEYTNASQTQNAFLRFNNNGGTTEVYSGIGTPENSVFAYSGSTYHRTDGSGASEQLYVKTTGIGLNTGWVALGAGGGGGGTLDDAYDFGGPGAGRIIDVDSGVVELNATGSAIFASTQNNFSNQDIFTASNPNGSGFALQTYVNGGGLWFSDSFGANVARTVYDGSFDNFSITNQANNVFRMTGNSTIIQSTAGLPNDPVLTINSNGPFYPTILRLGTTGGAAFVDQLIGTGDPEGGILANSGSVFFRMDGIGGSQQLYVKTTDASVNGWVALGAGAGGTLDDAYDFGGPGAGRIITVDSGAVEINGVNEALLVSTQNIVSNQNIIQGYNTNGSGFELITSPNGGGIRFLDMPNTNFANLTYQGGTDEILLSNDTGTIFRQQGVNTFVIGSSAGSSIMNVTNTSGPGTLRLSGTGANTIDQLVGIGDPEGVHLANSGSLFFRIDGVTNREHLYVKTQDFSTNGWLGIGGGTLDDSYDYGGPGAGRTILADSGAVRIQTVTGGPVVALNIHDNATSAGFNLWTDVGRSMLDFTGTTNNELNSNGDLSVNTLAGNLFLNARDYASLITTNNDITIDSAGGLTLGSAAFSTVFFTNGQERMRIANNGNVGIGTNGPNYMFVVEQDVDAQGFVEFRNNNSGLNAASSMMFSNNNAGIGFIQANSTLNGTLGGTESFNVNTMATYPLTLGTNNTVHVFVNGINGNVGIHNVSPTSQLHVGDFLDPALSTVATFENSSGTCTVAPDGAFGSFGCTSDSRLKNTITDYSTSALDTISQLQVRNYYMNNDPTNELKLGFIAQEVQSIVPDLVKVGADGFLQIKVNGFTPYLVKAIQELNEDNIRIQAEIDQLRTQLDGTDVTSLQSMAADLNLVLTNIKNDVDSLATNSFDITEINQRILDLENLIETIPVALSGNATVAAGNNSIHVNFSTPLTKIPSVTITPVGINTVYYGVQNVDQNGFDIVVEPISTSDILFNWIAL